MIFARILVNLIIIENIFHLILLQYTVLSYRNFITKYSQQFILSYSMRKFIVKIKLRNTLYICISRTHNKHSIHRLVPSECVQSPIHAYGHSYVGPAHLESFLLSMYLCDAHTHTHTHLYACVYLYAFIRLCGKRKLIVLLAEMIITSKNLLIIYVCLKKSFSLIIEKNWIKECSTALEQENIFSRKKLYKIEISMFCNCYQLQSKTKKRTERLLLRHHRCCQESQTQCLQVS